MTNRTEAGAPKLTIAILGDRNPEFRPHIVTEQSLARAAAHLGLALRVRWFATPAIADGTEIDAYQRADAYWISPGSPYRSLAGALTGVRIARESPKPVIGSCAGFQHMVLEYAQNVLGMKTAVSAQYDSESQLAVIAPLSCSLAGQTLPITLSEDSRIARAYGRRATDEQYYCSYGINPAFADLLFRGALTVTGRGENDEPRAVELQGERFYVGVLFVPDDANADAGHDANDSHPLVRAFLRAAQLMSIVAGYATPGMR